MHEQHVMWEAALFQEMVKTAPLLPLEEGRVENPLFHFFSVLSVPTFSKKEQFLFSSGLSGSWVGSE